jgi:Fe2+ transport system protein FeoA
MPASAADLLPLQFLHSGAVAEIDEVMGDTTDVHRLAELGLRPGATVEILQSGSPCLVRVGASKLALRGDDLLHVLVRLGAAS